MKIGDTLAGRYQLRGSLGSSSSSSELFAALDLRSRRDVAVRVFENAPPGSADGLAAMASLLAAASRVDHPAVVLPRIQRALTERPAFVAGELVPGDDLAAIAARGAIPWQRALDIALACSGALIALADATGVAHRALKPGNIRITPDGEVRVLDFGLAELGVRPVGARGDGSVVEYRAPEQLDGSPGNAGSDVFALGVLLFELVTGVHPYAGPTAYRVMHRLLTQQRPPTPSELAPEVPLPSQVEALIVRALAREPGARFKDAAELARHLALVRRSPGAAPPTRAPAPPPAGRAEEVETPPKKPDFIEEMTTALNFPILRSRQKAQEPAPAAPEPAAATSAPTLAPDSHAPGPPVAAMEWDERTETTLTQTIRDRVSPLRARTAAAPPQAALETTLELPSIASDPRSVERTVVDTTLQLPSITAPRAHARDVPPAQGPHSVEITTKFVRRPTASPPRNQTPPAPAEVQTVRSAPAPSGAPPERANALPPWLLLFNLLVMVLVVVGLYVLFTS